MASFAAGCRLLIVRGFGILPRGLLNNTKGHDSMTDRIEPPIFASNEIKQLEPQERSEVELAWSKDKKSIRVISFRALVVIAFLIVLGIGAWLIVELQTNSSQDIKVQTTL